MSRRHPLLLAVPLALLAVPARPAAAQATAYSDQNVTAIGTAPGIAGNFTLLRTGTSTHSYGDLTSVPGVAQDVQPLDANLSCQGGGCAGLLNNQWALHPPHLAQGDALIANTLRSARNDALVNLNAADFGEAFGTNHLEADVRLAQADMLFFTFTVHPRLFARLPGNATAGSTAFAALAFSVSILDLAPGAPLGTFFWAPDGAAGGITNGVETADPASLNTSLTQVGPGVQNHAPGARNFAARTNLLAAGDYRILIDAREDARVDLAVDPRVVPEPAVLALLAPAALALLGLQRRAWRGA